LSFLVGPNVKLLLMSAHDTHSPLLAWQ